MKSLSLKNKLLFLTLMLLFFCVFVGAIGLFSARNTAKSYGKIEEINLPNMASLLQGLAHMRSGRIYILELALPKQSDAFIKDMRAKVENSIAEYDAEDKIYNDIPFGEGEEAVYKPVKEQADLLKKDLVKALALHASSGGKEGPAMDSMRQFINTEIMDRGKSFRDELNKLLTWHRNDAKQSASIAHEAHSAGVKWIIIGVALSVVLGAFVSYFVVLKNILREQAIAAKAMQDAMRSYNMVEKAAINIMMSTPEGILTYMNEQSRATFKRLQQYLPEKVEDCIGKSIDLFHKNPNYQRKIIGDPKNLPHRAIISLGPEKLDLLSSAIFDGDGHYLGPMVSWEIVTEKVALVRDLTKASEDLAHAAANVLSISSNLSAAAEETSAQANTASVASEEVNAGVQTVAANMEEMVSAIREITKTTNEAAMMTCSAMDMAKNTNEIINQLGESSMGIGNVIKVISSIAQQTNLLALNATIEAARAGEAGKGFAVVANEVKELAKQTAKATSEITKKIETIQTDSKNAINAIAEISKAIEQVNGYTGNIASAVEEQAATTNEVTRIVTESAEGVKQINENISQVSSAAASTGRDAGGAQEAARNVGDIADLLKGYVARLK